MDLFEVSDPSEARGNTVTAREMLDKGAARVGHEELAKEPAIQATLMETLGTVYTGARTLCPGAAAAHRAVAIRRRLPGIDLLELSDSLSHQGDLLASQARVRRRREGLPRSDPHLLIASAGPAKPKWTSGITAVARHLASPLEGRYADFRKTLPGLNLRQTLYGTKDPGVARTLKRRSRPNDNSRRHPGAAIPLMQRALAVQRELRGNEPHPDLAEVLNDMGYVFDENGELDNAEKFYRESLDDVPESARRTNLYVGTSSRMLLLTGQSKGDFASAAGAFAGQSLEIHRDLQGEATESGERCSIPPLCSSTAAKPVGTRQHASSVGDLPQSVLCRSS